MPQPNSTGGSATIAGDVRNGPDDLSKGLACWSERSHCSPGVARPPLWSRRAGAGTLSLTKSIEIPVSRERGFDMTRRLKSSTTATFVGLVLVVSAVAPFPVHAAARAATVKAAVKRMVSARTSSAISLPSTSKVKIQGVQLATGAWTVVAKATVVNFGAADFARCRLFDATDKTVLDGSTTFVGSGASAGGPVSDVATLVVPSAATVVVQQQCSHDSSAGDGAYVDADASLVAFQTLDGSAAGQSSTHTDAQTALSTNVDSTVLSLSLGSGTYAIGAKASGVEFTGSSRVICVLVTSRGIVDELSLSLGTSTTTVATGSMFTYTSAPSGVVNLECSQTGTGAYLDPGTVLWARQVKSVTAVEHGCGAYLVGGATDLVALVRYGNNGCDVPPGSPAWLSAANIAKGNWVALGGESMLLNGTTNTDFARCELTTDSGHLDGTAATEFPNNAIVSVPLLGVVKATAPGTVYESCTRDSSAFLSADVAGSLVLIRI